MGIPASSVRYRVQRLKDAGILQVAGIANPLTIGFDRLAMIGIRVRPGTGSQRPASNPTTLVTPFVDRPVRRRFLKVN
ncbi:Lrp/AsnC family transcriptional regulator [Streptomyces sp. NPDC056159]|uniref:Lrp/AsnC family transcriptional regulator n=1 Tax=Streptomyces sp. NPDC056159 TaxID=3155537 RepID=UPI0034292DB5